LPAATFPGCRAHALMAVREGFEPSNPHSQATNNQCVTEEQGGRCTQIETQNADALCRQLSELVALWPLLGAQIRGALLDIARGSSRSERDGEHSGTVCADGFSRGEEVRQGGENS